MGLAGDSEGIALHGRGMSVVLGTVSGAPPVWRHWGGRTLPPSAPPQRPPASFSLDADLPLDSAPTLGAGRFGQPVPRFVPLEGPVARIPSATRLHFAELPRAGQIIFSGADARLTLSFDADGVTVDRTAGFDARFDEPVAVPLASGPLTLWLDSGTLEIESANGALWASFQHRLFGDIVSFEADFPAAAQPAIAGYLSQ